MIPEQVKAILFDLDGTLVVTFGVEPLPGRVERLAELRGEGYQIAICTNQAGPVWRYITAKTHFPTASDRAEQIKLICGALALEDTHWFVSIGDVRARDMIGPDRYQESIAAILAEFGENLNTDLIHVSGEANWRKPFAGMIDAACVLFGVEPHECLFIGDRSEDEEVASAAGCIFQWAHTFFEYED